MNVQRTKHPPGFGSLTLAFMLVVSIQLAVRGQAFVHPGGLHTLADLNRMKTNVLAGNHPWIDDWNVLITDSQAQTNYGTHVAANMGSSRQNADLDAHAAYLNFIRWYVSGDANYANKATNILNSWAAAVNVIPSGTDIPGLIGITIAHFAEDGELLRAYSGWKAADFQAYTNMMVTYLYPSCNSFLTNHNGACNSHYFANWDACNIEALIAMGVLCDNTNIYNQGVNYFISGAGNGSISNVVPHLYSGGLGQEQESGRDQEHAQLGVGELAAACQTAWNQGLDLFGFASNRLLAGAEYVAQYNLGRDVPYTSLNDCSGDNMFFAAVNGRGRLDDRPIWELIYNHYVVQQGLSAPNTKAMMQLYRPEHGSADHLGYGTLTFTLNATNSPYPPAPRPIAPVGLTTQAGISQVTLNWSPAAEDLAQGYNVLRSATGGGPYTTIATWAANASPNASPSYTDFSVVNGTTYYYVVSANNQSGTSDNSVEVSVTPATTALPSAWTSQDIGVVTSGGGVAYASAGDNTFVVTGHGTGIGGTSDGGFNYTRVSATNNFTIIARLTSNNADQMGLMMRASLATNAALVQFLMADNARQSIVGIRTGTGANLNHYDYGDQFTTPPAWYKLTRSGNTFNAYQSGDGVTWILVDSVTSVTMPTNYYAGLAINSGSATFDNVVYTNAAVAGTFAPPAAPSNLTATAITSNYVSMSWSSVANASGYNVKRSTISGSGYTIVAFNIAATAYYDASAAVGTTYYYVVSAVNGGGESANSTQASAATPVSAPPDVPVGLTATKTTDQISLNWSAVIGATGYNVKRSTTSGGPYTNIATDVVATFTDTNVMKGTIYFYVVSAVNGVGESANSPQVLGTLVNRLTGTIIGTSGSYNNLGNTKANVFDGNLNTFFDSPNSSGDWCGLDFGAGVSNVISVIQYCPRASYASRMLGGVFQGANDSGFASPTMLFTVTSTPSYSVMTSQAITATNAFRYVRYLGPSSANCNVAEIEFDGNIFVVPPSAPTNLLASGGTAQAALNWNDVSGAFGYNLKRSFTSGGPYSVVVSATAATNYLDTNVMNGVEYYYVVSAINAGGESANSLPASARPVSTSPTPLNFAIIGGQLQFNWASDHTGWQLEAQTSSLAGGLRTDWVPVAGSPFTNQMFVPVNPAGGSVFFRLIYP